jgi:hypothetical protein
VVSRIVGVHGIAQQQVGRHQLQAPWVRALADGLERSAGRRVGPPPLDIVFYGDLFLPPTAGTGNKKGFELGDTVGWDALSAADLADAVAAAGEVLSAQELAAAAEDAKEVKGFGRVPRPVAAVVAGLDRRFGPRAGALFVGELAQVRRYLLDPEIKAQVDARVADAVTEDCRVLIGHSLGSVVAFEFLRRHPVQHLELFVTLGSPLGLRAIHHHLPDPGFGSGVGVPPNIRTWVNLRNPRDSVACAGSLTQWWPGVQDGEVNNQKAAHSAERYLSKKPTGDALLAVLPELAP